MNLSNIKRVCDKIVLLTALLLRKPLEFYDRVTMMPETLYMKPFWLKRFGGLKLSYHPQGWEDAVKDIKQYLNVEKDFLREPALKEIQTEVRNRIEKIRLNPPFSLGLNADFSMACMCYFVCRVMKPAIVLETGVAYGVTSAFILKALKANGSGILHSVDMPPLERNADKFVGIFIPEELKANWRLHRGSSKRVFPSLLPELKQVDVSIHDSLATYRNIRRELQEVASHLSNPAFIIVDDAGVNSAFSEWIEQTNHAFWTVVQKPEKKTHFIVSLINNKAV